MMTVRIDQELCIGNCICAEVCPEMFVVRRGVAFVRSGPLSEDDGIGPVEVPASLEEAVIEAADECPGECIYLEAG